MSSIGAPLAFAGAGLGSLGPPPNFGSGMSGPGPYMGHDHPLRPLCSIWNEKLTLAMEYKKRKFQEDAEEALNFYNGPHDFMYYPKYATSSRGFVLGNEEDIPDPTFRMSVNKVAEMVQIFGPVLYYKNPQRQVNPRRFPAPPVELFGDPSNPNVQQAYVAIAQQINQSRAVDKARAALLEAYLNYTPDALDLKRHSRRAIDETIIKGAGVLWTELYQPAGSDILMVGSFYDSIDNLFIDPDMESFEDAKWIARKCVHPVWAVETEFGLPPGTLRGNLESYNQQAVSMTEEDADYQRKRGLSNDLLVYYRVYSKQGIGARLSGGPGGQASLDALRKTLDTFGDYVFLVIVPDVPYPLNLPPFLLEQVGADQEILKRLEWPTPFWADDAWPCSLLSFHEIPRSVWPMSHVKPAMGEQKFINWSYSMLTSKIRTTCRDFIACKKSAAEEIKSALTAGTDLTLLELEHSYANITEVVSFLQHPQWNGDIWKMVEAVEANFEKRVGLTELMYGMSEKQMRSAAEAQSKANQLQVRPDDMANKVEDWMSDVARKEALAARWHLTGKDVAPILGQFGAQLWQQLLETSTMSEVLHELEYRIEANSARKPNKDRDAQNMQQAMQALFGPMMQYASATGDFQAINKLIGDWAKSIDLDATGYLFKPPPPPPPMAAPPPGAPPPNGAARPPAGAARPQPQPAGPPVRR